MLSRPLILQHENGAAILIFEVIEEGGEMVCGIYKLLGWLPLPPKAWLRVVRGTLAEFEARMKETGVSEIRIRGRDWSRLLPDYEPFPAFPNGIRKRL